MRPGVGTSTCANFMSLPKGGDTFVAMAFILLKRLNVLYERRGKNSSRNCTMTWLGCWPRSDGWMCFYCELIQRRKIGVGGVSGAEDGVVRGVGVGLVGRGLVVRGLWWRWADAGVKWKTGEGVGRGWAAGQNGTQELLSLIARVDNSFCASHRSKTLLAVDEGPDCPCQCKPYISCTYHAEILPLHAVLTHVCSLSQARLAKLSLPIASLKAPDSTSPLSCQTLCMNFLRRAGPFTA